MNAPAPVEPIGGPNPVADFGGGDPTAAVARLLDLLVTAAWVSAAVSAAGVLVGVTMLAFGNRRAPASIIGGAVGIVIAVVAATTVIPTLQTSLG